MKKIKFIISFFCLTLAATPSYAFNLKDMWENFDIEFNKGFSPNAEVGGVEIAGKANYGYSVKKVYILGQPKHQRIDGYVLGLSGNAPLKDLVDIGLSLDAQVSYIRNFEKKGDAIKAIPRIVKHFPIDDKILLDPNDGIGIDDSLRMEFNSDGSLGKNFQSLLSNNLAAAISASAQKGTRFLIDIYRVDQTRVRMRLVAVRNMGSINAGLTTNLSLGAVTSNPLVNSFADKIFRCTPLDVSYGTSAGSSRPTDTLMADYVFDLSQPQAVTTYNNFMDVIFKAQLKSHFNFFQDSDQFQQHLQQYIQPMDDVFVEARDNNIDKSLRPIHRIFRGRAITESKAFSLSNNCLFGLISLHSKKYRNLTSLRIINQDDSVEDYMAFSHTHDTDGIFSDGIYRSHHLWRAEREASNDPLSLTPVEMEHLTIKMTNIDATQRKLEAKRVAREMSALYPSYLSTSDFTPMTDIKGGLFNANKDFSQNITISFDKTFLSSVPQDDRKQIEAKVDQMIKDAKSKKAHFGTANSQAADEEQRLFARSMAPAFNDAHLDELVKERQSRGIDETRLRYRFTAFSRLLRSSLFKEVGPAYLIQQVSVPINKDHSSIIYDVNVQPKKKDKFEHSFQHMGTTYNSLNDHILNMQSIINNRSFDLSIDPSKY